MENKKLQDVALFSTPPTKHNTEEEYCCRPSHASPNNQYTSTDNTTMPNLLQQRVRLTSSSSTPHNGLHSLKCLTVWLIVVMIVMLLIIDAQQQLALVSAQEWNYDPCTNGPQHWSIQYPLCGNGVHQSPIDINTMVNGTVRDDTLLPLKLHWKSGFGRVFFNGETCQTSLEPNTMYMTGGPLPKLSSSSDANDEANRYYMTQFHTHEVSEHHIDGVAYPLEIHFVHKNTATGALAVVGFFFKVTTDEDSAFLNEFIDFCYSNTSTNDYLSFESLVRDSTSLPYITYDGSLTTPPCSESVTWILINSVFSVSRSQLRRFMSILPHHIANNRPIQDINQRVVRQYVPPGTETITVTWSQIYKLQVAIAILAIGFTVSSLLFISVLLHKYVIPALTHRFAAMPTVLVNEEEAPNPLNHN